MQSAQPTTKQRNGPRAGRRGFTETRPFDREELARTLIECLNKSQLEVAVWYWFEGRSLVWIARTLGISKNAVVRRRRRIVKKLNDRGFPEPVRLINPMTTDKVINFNLED